MSTPPPVGVGNTIPLCGVVRTYEEALLRGPVDAVGTLLTVGVGVGAGAVGNGTVESVEASWLVGTEEGNTSGRFTVRVGLGVTVTNTFTTRTTS